MKQFNIKEYNKMCADFLGYVNLTPDDPDFDYYEHPDNPVKIGGLVKVAHIPSLMKFHEDWNLIMEVVEKIEETHFTDSYSRIGDVEHEFNIWNKTTTEISGRGENKKDAVVKAIWEFLNWYKTQTP